MLKIDNYIHNNYICSLQGLFTDRDIESARGTLEGIMGDTRDVSQAVSSH